MWPDKGLELLGGPRGYDFQAERAVGKRATEGRIDIAVVDINAVDVFFEACHRFARSEIVLMGHIGLFVAHKAPPHVVGHPLSCQAGLELCPKCVEVLCGCVKPSGLTVMMKPLAHYAAQRVVGLRAGQVRKEAARFRLPAETPVLASRGQSGLCEAESCGLRSLICRFESRFRSGQRCRESRLHEGSH